MTTPSPGGARSRSGSPAAVMAVVVVGVLAIAGIAALAVSSSDDGDDTATTDEETTDEETTDEETTTSTAPPATTEPTTATDGDDADGDAPVGADIGDLARATVLLLQLDGQGNPACFSGSGSIVAPDGLILTNAHVVENVPDCPYEQLGVLLTDRTDRPPQLAYLGEVVGFDPQLDLAAVQVTSLPDGSPVDDLALPYVEIGDSDTVELGDPLRVLGFPGIGGDTITFTEGAVSGFVAERGIDADRAWIKTDATIAGGNSGGMAVDEAGVLVAVPTIAGAGADAATTDCRIIEDTNGDGFVDGADSCVPIGGFINGLRPVNLAVDLLESSDEAVDPVGTTDPEPVDFEPAEVLITSLEFAAGVTADDRPTEVITFLPAGRERLCAFFAYEGMRDGVTWDAIWYVDGELNQGGSFLGESWGGGETGRWWVCISDDAGLPSGLYEFEVAVAGESRGANAIFVGGSRRPATLVVENRSGVEICYVQVSPTEAAFWGPDDLGSTETVPSGADRVFDDLVTGRWDVRLQDCDLAVLDEVLGLDLTDGVETVTFTGS